MAVRSKSARAPRGCTSRGAEAEKKKARRLGWNRKDKSRTAAVTISRPASWRLRIVFSSGHSRALTSWEDYWSVRGEVLVDPATLHAKEEVLDRLLDQLDIGQRIAIDQQKVG